MSKKKNGNYAYTNLVLISQFAIHMMVPIFLCLAIGIYLDHKYHWYLTLPMLILGMLAGCRNTYALAKRANKKSDGERVSKEEREFVDAAFKEWNKGRQFTTKEYGDGRSHKTKSEEEQTSAK